MRYRAQYGQLKTVRLIPQEGNTMDEQTKSAPQYLPTEESKPTDKIQLASYQPSENSASVDLSINYDALSVSVRSQSSLSADLIELASQVKLLKEQLSESVAKAQEAN